MLDVTVAVDVGDAAQYALGHCVQLPTLNRQTWSSSQVGHVGLVSKHFTQSLCLANMADILSDANMIRLAIVN